MVVTLQKDLKHSLRDQTWEEGNKRERLFEINRGSPHLMRGWIDVPSPSLQTPGFPLRFPHCHLLYIFLFIWDSALRRDGRRKRILSPLLLRTRFFEAVADEAPATFAPGAHRTRPCCTHSYRPRGRPDLWPPKHRHLPSRMQAQAGALG